MKAYILRRIAQFVFVFFGSTFLVFALVYVLPGDPAMSLGGVKPLPPDLREVIVRRYHLDEPLLVQYMYYMKGIFTLDFGTSFSGRPVLDVLIDAFPWTFTLAVMTIVIESVFGIAFGIFAGLKRGGVFDVSILVISTFLISVPTFVLGFVLQFFVGVKLGWLPVTASIDMSFTSLLMPSLVLGAVSFAYILRLTRVEIAENYSARYVRTARAKGLRESGVIAKHVVRNSMIPVLTYIGTDFGALMGGAIVTEGIFNIPGIGGTLFKAILKSESSTVVSFSIVIILAYILSSFLVDIIYVILDPRIRYE
ncbi:MAG: ABC transporter permease [Actinomycetaceae bacterium]|nr:ABC transporter permease [Actinomycetaceae bacterium]